MSAPVRLTPDALDALISAVRDDGFRVLGPVRDELAIVVDEIDSTADLPAGWTAEQDAGTYRLKRRDDDALFGYATGPWSARRWLHPPEETYQRVRATAEGLEFYDPRPDPPSTALFGIRACDIAAIGVQDRVMMHSEHLDAGYQARRDATAIIAVQCTEPGGTCFCSSMGTGPHVGDGADIVLTELLDADGHRLVAEARSERGARWLNTVGAEPAAPADEAAVTEAVDRAAGSMGRALDTSDLHAALPARAESKRWSEIAERCLACTNCTLVCPTCFCTSTRELTALDGTTADRSRHWDSCFNTGFSYIHGGAIRQSVGARYRQWLTHKLSTWIDQFGSSGCVGCGRCVTWCPVGIDITEEAAALQQEHRQAEAS